MQCDCETEYISRLQELFFEESDSRERDSSYTRHDFLEHGSGSAIFHRL